MKALASILFEISCTQDFQILFSKGHNSEKGRNSDMKKIRVNYFFMRNVHVKFQNPSIHHSKVNTHTHRRTDTQTHRHTDKPKAICPSNFFKVGGIKMYAFRLIMKYVLSLKQVLFLYSAYLKHIYCTLHTLHQSKLNIQVNNFL